MSVIKDATTVAMHQRAVETAFRQVMCLKDDLKDVIFRFP